MANQMTSSPSAPAAHVLYQYKNGWDFGVTISRLKGIALFLVQSWRAETTKNNDPM